MAYLAKGLIEDLKILAEDLGIETSPDFTVLDLKNAIVNSKDYDKDFCKERLSTIISLRKEAVEEEKERRREALEEERRREALEEERRREALEEEKEKRREALEEARRKDELQLEFEKLRVEVECAKNGKARIEDTKNPSKEFRNLIQKFDTGNDINLYLVLFERQARRVSLPKEEWVTHLLGLLPYEITQLIAREPEDKVEDYDFVKDILLKRFKLTPEKFRQLFASHQKSQNGTWRDFYHELYTYFEGWLSGLKITTFEQLRDLIISDQIKKRSPVDFRDFYLDEWSNIVSPIELVEKLDDFENVKRPKKMHNLEQDQPKNTKHQFPNFRNKFSGNNDVAEGIFGDRFTEKTEKQRVLKCFECGESGHFKSHCPEFTRKNNSLVNKTNEKESSDVHIISTSNDLVFKKVQTKEITFNNVSVIALVDSGSFACLLREDAYEQIGGLPKLSNDCILLSGFGSTKVWSKGSFDHVTEIDGSKFMLTWHVVPTSELCYKAVIGIVIVDQASLNFNKNGVKFCKYETNCPSSDFVVEDYRVPDKMVGLIIGRGGQQITRLQSETGCKIQFASENIGAPDRSCTLTGPREAVQAVKEMINEIIRKANSPFPPNPGHVTDGQYVTEMMIPGPKVGLLIGKGGENIRKLQEKGGVKMILIQDDPQQTAHEKQLRISGDSQKVEFAKQMVMSFLAQKEKHHAEFNLKLQRGYTNGGRPFSQEEMIEELQKPRNLIRQKTKKNIQKIQIENKRTYDRKRKKAPEYKIGDLVAIQRNQFGTGLKLQIKYFGPYKITKVNTRDRYEVEKVGDHPGPNKTTTSADMMKYFSKN